MKRGWVLACVATFVGCGEHGSSPGDGPPDAALSSAKEITSFRFLAVDNPAVIGDAIGTIVGDDIDVTAPFILTVAGLTATFTTTGASVTVLGQPQTSGFTQNTFAANNPVRYTVIAEDGSTRTYTVHVAGPSFRPKVDFGTGTTPASVTTGDFNGDGKPDLATTSRSPAVLSILLDQTAAGAASPTFGKTDFAAGGIPGLLAIGDINSDGRPDVAVVTATQQSSHVSLFVNTTVPGATAPTFAARSDLPAAQSVNAVAFADINADGKPDLAVTNAGIDNSVSIYLNTTMTGSTAATFATKVDIPTGSAPYSVVAGDLDSDGKPDLVVAHTGGFRPVVALINTTQAGAATPSFAANRVLLSNENTLSAYLGDLNADGKVDLVLDDGNPVGALVLVNTTTTGTTPPTFAAPVLVATGGTPAGIAIVDVDGDLTQDLVAVTSASTLALLLGTTAPSSTPSFRTRREYATTSAADSVAIGDFNGDGKPDVAVANSTAASVSVLLAE